MKAIVYKKYGAPLEVMQLEEVDKPTAGEREVLVRVHAAGVGAGDWHLLTGTIWAVRLYQGLFKPKRPVLGHEFAGTVESVGAGVTRFQPGNAVFGESTGGGAFAEYVCVAEKNIAPKPTSLSYEEAAAVPVSALTALQGLRDKGRIRAGHTVLINGASGGVGTYAVQIAKSYGADVTGVCSATKMDLVRSLGADHVIDYRQDDFTQSGKRYDLILDLAGKHSLADCKRALTAGGIYVVAAGAPMRTLRAVLFGGKKMAAFIAQPNEKDLAVLTELLESGKLKPVIDRRFPLSDVPQAIQQLGNGKVRGKVVITVQPS